MGTVASFRYSFELIQREGSIPEPFAQVGQCRNRNLDVYISSSSKHSQLASGL